MTHKAALLAGGCALLIIGAAALIAAASVSSLGPEEAANIFAATGVKGGLIVHLGCGDGKLTAALHAGNSYLVQGLDTDPAAVAAAQQYLRSLGLYGPVSVAPWSGKELPYNDNLVNLLVTENLDKCPMAEVLRVLAPNGVAYVRQGDQWTKTVKPRPAQIDEWTHYLHDPSNNAVAHDSQVGPPRRMQWIDDPRNSRHHDHMSAVSAMVSSGGRTFYIVDEATRASILTPPQWSLVARDAFSGVLLWKQSIDQWHSHLWPLKSGPQLLTRRLVAMDDRLYVTLGLNAPLTELDAATGETLHTYEDTAATEEILVADGVLYLVVNRRLEPTFTTFQGAKEAAEKAWPDEGKRHLMAVQAATGKVLWQKEDRILPETLAVAGDRVFYHDGQKIVCLSRPTGSLRWASPPISHKSLIQSYFTPTLVIYKDIVLFSGGIDTRVADFGGSHSPIYGLSAVNGKILWKGEQPPCGHHTPKDLLVANGLLWYGETAQPTDSGEMTARDPVSGRIVKHFLPDTDVPWFHHRCYRAKATDKYLLFSRTGVEFIDTSNNHWTPNNWVRGACMYGIMPCNGMLYVPPHPCACYSESKLYGFVALAPAASTIPPPPVPDSARLVRGPAYIGAVAGAPPAPRTPDWPTYRHDAARSGSTKSLVPVNLKGTWWAELGGRLSSVVIDDGKLLVSSLDTCTIHALDAATGKPLWTYTAGGRVDSAPTLWQGLALFGCNDGYVYCLRAADGALAWRFLAAPRDRRMVAYEQVESVWPVSGSVLVHDGVVYCVAGRSMFLDGGLRLLRLDAKSGRLLSTTAMDDRDPTTGKNLQSKAVKMNLPVAMPDILSCDGRNVYMRSLPFDLSGRRRFIQYVSLQELQGSDHHLFSPTGFLDDTLWHRTYWVFGRAWASAAGGYYLAGRVEPSGRIMVFDDTTIWGYGRRWQYYRWSTPYVNHLFSCSREAPVIKMSEPAPTKVGPAGKKRSALGQTPTTRFAYRWSDESPVQVTAMVHAGSTLFVAGPPNLIDEEEAAKAMDNPTVRAKIVEQGEAYDGHKGAILTAVSAADGKSLASYHLSSMPVFDGMAAARGRLYLATTDGKILCLGSDEGRPLNGADTVKRRPPDADNPLTTLPARTAPGRRRGR